MINVHPYKFWDQSRGRGEEKGIKRAPYKNPAKTRRLIEAHLKVGLKRDEGKWFGKRDWR